MSHGLFQHRQRTQVSRDKAFTTIELIVVIGIIIVLAGLVFVGISHVSRSSRENSTKTTLANLQGMFADFESTSKLSKRPGKWLWVNTGGSAIESRFPDPLNDFWKGPSTAGTTTFQIDHALASPGDISADTTPQAVNQRNGSVAIVNTGLAMTLISSLPDNRSRLQALPANQQYALKWNTGTISMPGGGVVPLQYTAGSFVTHTRGDLATKQTGQFVASGSYSSGNPEPVFGAQTGEWIDITGKQTPAPLLLDAWDNPIIFVPATGLRVRLQNDPSREVIILSPEGEANNTANPPTIVRIGRPFWASAGADGSFDRLPGPDGSYGNADDKPAGDDNMYSFEK